MGQNKKYPKFDPEGKGYDDKTADSLIVKYPLTIPKPTHKGKPGEFHTSKNEDGERSFQAWVWHSKDDKQTGEGWFKHGASHGPGGLMLKGMGGESAKKSIDYEKSQGYHYVKRPDGRYYIEKMDKESLGKVILED